MPSFKGIKIETFKPPPILEVKRPVFEFNAEKQFTFTGKDPIGEFAQSSARLNEMTITPDFSNLSKNLGVRYLNLSTFTETNLRTTLSPKAAIAGLVLAGALGVVIKNPEIVSWMVDLVKGVGSWFSLGLLPVVGMVTSGRGPDKFEERLARLITQVEEKMPHPPLRAERASRYLKALFSKYEILLSLEQKERLLALHESAINNNDFQGFWRVREKFVRELDPQNPYVRGLIRDIFSLVQLEFPKLRRSTLEMQVIRYVSWDGGRSPGFMHLFELQNWVKKEFGDEFYEALQTDMAWVENRLGRAFTPFERTAILFTAVLVAADFRIRIEEQASFHPNEKDYERPVIERRTVNNILLSSLVTAENQEKDKTDPLPSEAIGWMERSLDNHLQKWAVTGLQSVRGGNETSYGGRISTNPNGPVEIPDHLRRGGEGLSQKHRGILMNPKSIETYWDRRLLGTAYRYPYQGIPASLAIHETLNPPAFPSITLAFITSEGKQATYDFPQKPFAALRFTNKTPLSPADKIPRISDPLLGTAEVSLSKLGSHFSLLNYQGDMKILRDIEGTVTEIPVPVVEPLADKMFTPLDPKIDTLVINGMRFYFNVREQEKP